MIIVKKKNNPMSRNNTDAKQKPFVSYGEWIVLAILIVLGIAARFWIETPNFKPVAAFALFGGFFFRKPSLAIVGMIFVMTISDLQLGFYPWQLMVCVYLSLAISVLLGMTIRSRVGKKRISWSHLAGFLGASLTMSTLFFLLTNGAVWLMGGWYPLTLAGLAECYLAGLPFYRWTILGDLFFTTITVSCFSMVVWYSTYRQLDSKKQATQLLGNSW
jgi:hypothetical protein